MGYYYPEGFEPITAQLIVDEYNSIIDDIRNKMFNDFEDHLIFDPNNPNVFYLKYIPVNVRLSVNGILYYRDLHFTFDRETREITWIFGPGKGGFELEERYNYVAIYDLFYEANNITDINGFIESLNL